MAKDNKMTLSALLNAGGCTMSYTSHPHRPRRYYIDGRMVTPGFFETVEATARRRDCFHARSRRGRDGGRYLTFYSHASFRA